MNSQSFKENTDQVYLNAIYKGTVNHIIFLYMGKIHWNWYLIQVSIKLIHWHSLVSSIMDLYHDIDIIYIYNVPTIWEDLFTYNEKLKTVSKGSHQEKIYIYVKCIIFSTNTKQLLQAKIVLQESIWTAFPDKLKGLF